MRSNSNDELFKIMRRREHEALREQIEEVQAHLRRCLLDRDQHRQMHREIGKDVRRLMAEELDPHAKLTVYSTAILPSTTETMATECSQVL